ncbi:YlbG family protein [Limosilactobacillus sp. STM2_1]|uniref:YlbG family protein n=1 Tax=Limosilactobacillus rudii TaxID=2759755 RepID=A0A7W3UKL0_9LACO|nr:YlbG family protein [Limosilactobacillus rudii]MBB1078584.1 YlbG family protein [Limosilactobacillus rudii]MBB1097224.1 YlbG family protein [Limosilactobacillus rudii]MCD7133860.1 YlbG family protein [Limosilactobacillus rudii]
MFELTPRRSLVVYTNGNRVIRALRHYGQIEYISRRMHYVILYVNQNDIEKVSEKIGHLRAVRKVDISARPDLDPTLADLELTGVYQLHDEDEKK